jgi:superfamily II DNA/RNA helicase
MRFSFWFLLLSQRNMFRSGFLQSLNRVRTIGTLAVPTPSSFLFKSAPSSFGAIRSIHDDGGFSRDSFSASGRNSGRGMSDSGFSRGGGGGMRSSDSFNGFGGGNRMRNGGNFGGNSHGRSHGGGGGQRGRSGGRGQPLMRYSSKQSPLDSMYFKNVIQIDPTYQRVIDEMEGMSKLTKQALTRKGFAALTPIQSQAYDLVLAGDDIVGRSRTGTGKTLAFGIPLIEQLIKRNLHNRRDRKQKPLIVILEPTRELAIQVTEELNAVARPHKLYVQSVFGGSSINTQASNLNYGSDIVVATPGRLIDLLERGYINFSQVSTVVLDEADLMLEMGFQEDVERILSHVKKTADAAAIGDLGVSDDTVLDDMKTYQMLFFSATMPPWICKLTGKLMKDPVFIDAVKEGETRLADTLEHYNYLVPTTTHDRFLNVMHSLEDIFRGKIQDIVIKRRKTVSLTANGDAGTETETKSLEEVESLKGGRFPGQIIIFTETKRDADRLAMAGRKIFGKMSIAPLHGDIAQAQRQYTLRQFKDKYVDILIATDVAARGLDISGVELVVHMNPPKNIDQYVHRSGRTGRAGRPGTTVLFHTREESRELQALEDDLNFFFTPLSADKVFHSEKKKSGMDDDNDNFFDNNFRGGNGGFDRERRFNSGGRGGGSMDRFARGGHNGRDRNGGEESSGLTWRNNNDRAGSPSSRFDRSRESDGEERQRQWD